MSCAIIAGYSLDCKDAVAGIKTIYITEHANLTATTANASGEVTAITKAGGSKFYAYALEPRGQNNFTQEIQADPTIGTVAYTQTVVANFVKLKYETQYVLERLIKNRMAMIVETKDGSFFLFGKDFGVEVSAGTGNSGQAMNEFQGYQLTFTGMEKAFAPEVAGSIIPALLT